MNISKEGVMVVTLSRAEVLSAIALYVANHTQELLHIPDERDAVDLSMGAPGNIILTIRVQQ